MSKVYTSACVIIPPEKIWESIQRIRQKYDRNIHRWMPHITLLYPFRQIEQFDELEKQFAVICHKINPFEIVLRTFKFFNHGRQNYTIWLYPEPSDLIMNLQNQILKVVPECNDVNKHKKGFTPHLSVGQIRGKKKFAEVLNKIQEGWNELKFKVNFIYFISRQNTKLSKFEIIKKIQLNAPS